MSSPDKNSTPSTASSAPGVDPQAGASDLETARLLAESKKSAADAPKAAKYPDRAYVVSKGGRMVHLLQNVEITDRPVKIDIDSFARVQLDAGKWALFTPE